MPELVTKRSKAGWTTVAFGDVVRQVKDKVDPEDSGLERYIAGEHMDTDDLRIRRWGEIGEGYLGPAFHMRFKPGHVLYGSRRTYLRKVAVADFEGITANTTYVLESADPEVLLPELLPFIMQTDAFNRHSVRESKGSVNPYVNFSDLAWFEFALPPIEEQRRIAQSLATTDACVDSVSIVTKLHDALYEAWLEEMFKQCSRTGADLFVDDLCREVTVGIVVTPSKYFAKEGVLAISHSNIFLGEIDGSNADRIDATAHEKLSKTWLRHGDVVLPRVSTTTGKPYYAAVVPAHLDRINSIGIVILRPKSECITPGYLEAILNSPSMRRRLIGVAVGSIQRQLNIKIIAKERIPVVPMDRQRAIAETSATFKASRTILRDRLDAASDLRQLMLQRVFEQ